MKKQEDSWPKIIGQMVLWFLGVCALIVLAMTPFAIKPFRLWLVAVDVVVLFALMMIAFVMSIGER